MGISNPSIYMCKCLICVAKQQLAVLTFLFNLVASLSIWMVAGMMTGASRRFSWQVVSVSLVPVVALALGPLRKWSMTCDNG